MSELAQQTFGGAVDVGFQGISGRGARGRTDFSLWPLAEARSSLSHVRSQRQTGRRFSLGSTAAFDPRRT